MAKFKKRKLKVQKTKKTQKRREKQISFSIKELDNKSRKGMYLYIREKGIKGAYYKISERQTVKDIIDYFKLPSKKKRKTKIQTFLKGRIKAKTKVQKGKRIEPNIKQGRIQVKVNDLEKAGDIQIRNAYKQMLKPLVEDKQLLEVLTQEENMKKIKKRIAIKINGIGQAEETIFTITKASGKTLKEVKEDSKRFGVLKGTEIKKGNYNTQVEQKARNMGYQAEIIADGTMVRMETIMTFRKGR